MIDFITLRDDRKSIIVWLAEVWLLLAHELYITQLQYSHCLRCVMCFSWSTTKTPTTAADDGRRDQDRDILFPVRWRRQWVLVGNATSAARRRSQRRRSAANVDVVGCLSSCLTDCGGPKASSSSGRRDEVRRSNTERHHHVTSSSRRVVDRRIERGGM